MKEKLIIGLILAMLLVSVSCAAPAPAPASAPAPESGPMVAEPEILDITITGYHSTHDAKGNYDPDRLEATFSWETNKPCYYCFEVSPVDFDYPSNSGGYGKLDVSAPLPEQVRHSWPIFLSSGKPHRYVITVWDQKMNYFTKSVIFLAPVVPKAPPPPAPAPAPSSVPPAPKTTKVIPGEGEKGIGVSGSYPAFTIDECIEHSDTIVIGKVTEILPARWGKHPIGDVIYQDVIVQTERYLYGEPESEFIAINVWGGKVGDTYMIVDSDPLFTVGEKTLLCLHRPPEEVMETVPEGIDPRSYYRVTASIPGKYDFKDGILTDYKGQTTNVATFEEKIAVLPRSGR